MLIGNITLVNGKSWPYFEVEPRKYRFRVLNGFNSRPYRLRLVPDAEPETSLPYHQIGTDGGLLDKPVAVRKIVNGAPVGPQVTVAPAERADIVVDFSGFASGDIIKRCCRQTKMECGTWCAYRPERSSRSSPTSTYWVDSSGTAISSITRITK